MATNSRSIEVEIFPAAFGDAILVRCVSGLESVNILIDGGVRSTYEHYIEKRLRELGSQGHRLNLLVVTHFDTDHIGGVLELLKDNGPAATPDVIEISDIWHNGYRHLEMKGRPPTTQEKQAVLSQISSCGGPIKRESDISVREADTVAALISRHGYAWNQAFSGEAALAGKKVSIAQSVDLTLLSPTRRELDGLAYLWRRELLTMGVSHEAVVCPEFEAAFEAEMPQADQESPAVEDQISVSTSDEIPDPATFVEDTSVTNGSSIAFLLGFHGKRLMFLGDSWPTVISEQWDRISEGGDPDCLDLIKVSHHGSRQNTSPKLLERLKARYHVVSTDGSKHSHPHAEALLRIVGSNQSGTILTFNYPSATAASMNREALRNRYGHKVSIGSGLESVRIVLTTEDESGS